MVCRQEGRTFKLKTTKVHKVGVSNCFLSVGGRPLDRFHGAALRFQKGLKEEGNFHWRRIGVLDEGYPWTLMQFERYLIERLDIFGANCL